MRLQDSVGKSTVPEAQRTQEPALLLHCQIESKGSDGYKRDVTISPDLSCMLAQGAEVMHIALSHRLRQA